MSDVGLPDGDLRSEVVKQNDISVRLCDLKRVIHTSQRTTKTFWCTNAFEGGRIVRKCSNQPPTSRAHKRVHPLMARLETTRRNWQRNRSATTEWRNNITTPQTSTTTTSQNSMTTTTTTIKRKEHHCIIICDSLNPTILSWGTIMAQVRTWNP